MKTKRCSKCKRELSLDEFSKNKQAKDGLQYWCKGCVSENERARLEKRNPDAIKILTYSQKHRTINNVNQKLCICCRIWQPLNKFYKDRIVKGGLTHQCKTCIKTRVRIYQQSNQGKIAKRGKKYRQAHKVEIAQRDKKYQQTHKIEIAECSKKYRQTLKGYLSHVFDGIIRRCQNPKNDNYENYGGRGIEVQCTPEEFYHHITVTLGYDTLKKLKGLEIDRIDTNDHYKISNLRIVTSGQNSMNSRKPRTWHGRPCSSRFKGVHWVKQRNKWYACIIADGKHHYLGSFTDEIAAAEAYDEASLKYHGEFGATNRSLGLFDVGDRDED